MLVLADDSPPRTWWQTIAGSVAPAGADAAPALLPSVRHASSSSPCHALHTLPRCFLPSSVGRPARTTRASLGSLVRLTRPFFSKRRAMLLTVGGSTPKHSHNSDCRHAPRKLAPGTSRKRPVRSAGPGDANVHRLHYGRSDTPAREDSRDPVQSWSRSGKKT